MKYNFYKILAGKYYQKQGEVRKEFGVGDIAKISEDEAKKMGKGKVALIASADGVKETPTKIREKSSKVVIPVKRVKDKRLKKRIKKNKPKPADEVVKELSDEEMAELISHKGGGYYLLTDGSKVKGKAEAIKAQRELL